MWKIVSVDYFRLVESKVGLLSCPYCGMRPFRPFLRGHVKVGVFLHWWEEIVAALHKRLPKTYCLICDCCKEIVAREDIQGKAIVLRKYRKHLK